jgi:hypothetical protein
VVVLSKSAPSKCALIAALAVCLIAAEPLRAEDSFVRSVAKSAGFATDPAPPADFVVTSRPSEELAPIPVFKTPEEPPSKVKSKSELKAMDADLDSVAKKHDTLRAAFPPTAKAMAEQQAAQKPKPRKTKPAKAIAPKP